METIYLVGGNVVKDAGFRRKMTGRDAAGEFQAVLEDLIQSRDCNEKGPTVELSKDKPRPKDDYERNQLKITLKIFLRDFSDENLQEALNAALDILDTDHVDSLFLAAPSEAMPVIGLGSGNNEDDDHAEAFDSLMKLWNQVGVMIEKKQVLAAGLSDLRPAVFIDLYSKSQLKPNSIQVNLKTCCVIPQELSSFAKENKIDLLTHNDPEELITEEGLRTLLFPHLGREAGHFSPNWIARFQVHVRDRGVLVEKRYLAKLAK